VPPSEKKQTTKKPKEILVEETLQIFKTKRQHITRFDGEEWEQVVEILLIAMAKGMISWIKLQPMIGGGHPIPTLKGWCRHLKKTDIGSLIGWRAA
jgi:hypothetical protein